MKKVIGFVLCLCMVCSLFAVNVSANLASDAQKAIFDGDFIRLRTQDYEGTDAGMWVANTTGVSDAVIDENNCVKLSYPSGGYINAAASVPNLSLTTGAVAKFDIMKKADGAPIFVQFIDGNLDMGSAVGFKSSALAAAEKWYTVVASAKIVNNAVAVQLAVFDKETGECTYLTQTNASTINNASTAASGVGLWYHSLYASYVEEGVDLTKTEYYVDNAVIYNYPTVTKSGVWIERDFETADALKASNPGSGVVSFKGEEENAYLHIDMGTTARGWVSSQVAADSGAEISSDSHMVMLDVYKECDSYSLSVWVQSATNSATGGAKSYIIPAYQCEAGKWYTYKIICENGSVTAYRKLKTDAEFTQIDTADVNTALPGGNSAAGIAAASTRVVYASGGISSQAANDNTIYIGYEPAGQWTRCHDISAQNGNGLGSKWRVDNIKLGALDNATVVNYKNGIQRFSKIEASTADAAAENLYSIVGYYGDDGRLVDAEFSKTALDAGEGEGAMFITWTDNATYTNSVGAGGEIKAFVWKDGCVPVVTPIDITSQY